MNCALGFHDEEKITAPIMPPDVGQRYGIPSPSIDSVVVLGTGFLYFDNSPLGVLPKDKRDSDPRLKWVWVNAPDGNLLFLFLHLTQTTSSSSTVYMEMVPYLTGHVLSNIGAGP